MKDQWYFNTGVLVKSSLGADQLTSSDLEQLGVDFSYLNTDKGDFT